MKKSNLDSLFYSAGGLVMLAIILIAANFLLGTFKARVDLTQGSVYTLSPGTRAILSKLEAPVKIRYYYTQGGNTVPIIRHPDVRRMLMLMKSQTEAARALA